MAGCCVPETQCRRGTYQSRNWSGTTCTLSVPNFPTRQKFIFPRHLPYVIKMKCLQHPFFHSSYNIQTWLPSLCLTSSEGNFQLHLSINVPSLILHWDNDINQNRQRCRGCTHCPSVLKRCCKLAGECLPQNGSNDVCGSDGSTTAVWMNILYTGLNFILLTLVFSFTYKWSSKKVGFTKNTVWLNSDCAFILLLGVIVTKCYIYRKKK